MSDEPPQPGASARDRPSPIDVGRDSEKASSVADRSDTKSGTSDLGFWAPFGDVDGYIFPTIVRQFLTGPDQRDVAIPSELLSTRAFNAFRRTGIRRLGQLALLRVEDVLGVRNLGVKTVFDMRRALSAWVRANPPGAPEISVAEPSHDEDNLRMRGPSAPSEEVEPVIDDEDAYVFSEAIRQVLVRADLRNQTIPSELLSTRAYNGLRRGQIVNLGQLATLRVDHFLGLRNVGARSLLDLRESLPGWLQTAPRDVWRTSLSEPPSDDASAMPAIEDVTIEDMLPDELRDQLRQIGPVIERVSARDQRFGAHRLPDVPMSTLLFTQVADVEWRGVTSPMEIIEPRLALLVDRVARPIPLIDELEEVLPGIERWASICRSRWGWDGSGPKTLEETGAEFNLTRERVRQIEKKTRERRLKGVSAYLPTAEALLALLKDMGGAAYESDLGASALERGLVRTYREVGALESLSELGFISGTDVRRVRGQDGEAALSLGEQDTSELVRIGVRTRRILGRRGIASVAEVLTDLEGEGIPASEGEVRATIERSEGVEYLGGRQFYWRPADANSAFVRKVEKPLVILGPQRLGALGRALRRATRLHTYGPIIPKTVLAEALARSPFFREADDDRWAWAGPLRPVPLGIAEAPLLELLRRDGPALGYAEIRARLVAIEGVTLLTALSHSALIERVASGVYALVGAPVLPGDVEEARRRARSQSPAVQLVDSGWEGGAVVVRWDVLNRRLWNNVLTVPTRHGLQGRWELRGDSEIWTTTVEGGNLWGGIGVWVSSQSVEYPARLILRFDLTDRHIDPELVEHDTLDGATKG